MILSLTKDKNLLSLLNNLKETRELNTRKHSPNRVAVTLVAKLGSGLLRRVFASSAIEIGPNGAANRKGRESSKGQPQPPSSETRRSGPQKPEFRTQT